MDFRKKVKINNSNVIMIILMLELLEWSPTILGFVFKPFAERVCRKSLAERVCGKSQVGCGLRHSTMLIEEQVQQSLQKELCGKSQELGGQIFSDLRVS